MEMAYRNLVIFAVLFFTINFASADQFVGKPCSEFIYFKDVAFVCADHPDYGKEVHVVNGEEYGTEILLDIDPGPGNSSPRGFFTLDEHLYFFAENSLVGESLWRTDGTKEGTKKIISISNKFGMVPIAPKIEFDGYVYFEASGSNRYSAHLFRTDGTTQGTELLDIPISPLHNDLPDHNASYQEFNNALYIMSFGEMYRIDSNKASNTGLVFAGSVSTTLKGLIFLDKMVVRSSGEIWLSDGTIGGTTRFRWNEDGDSSYYNIRVIQNSMLFTKADSGLFVTKGDSDVKLSNLSYSYFGQTKNNLWFWSDQDYLLANGTLMEPKKVGITPHIFGLYRRGNSVLSYKQSIYFAAGELGSESRIEVVDESTGVVNVLKSEMNRVRPIDVIANGVLFASCIDECEASGAQHRPSFGIWLVNQGGEVILLKTYRGFSTYQDYVSDLRIPNVGFIRLFHEEGSRAYFSINNSESGLWHSGGTSASTYLLKYSSSIVPSSGSGNTSFLTPIIDLILKDR